MSLKNKKDETSQLKKYLRYIIGRVTYLKSGVCICSDNQFKYYSSLLDELRSWGDNHKLYWKYLLGKFTFEEVKAILGEDDRQIFRYLLRQRTKLINFIQNREEYLSLKYPFKDKLVFEI